MQYLIYVSSAVKLFTDADLKELLIKSRDNNKQNNITGVLLYSGGTFMQVLEGEQYDIATTFSKINADPSHTGIIKLIEARLDTRIFPEWFMGFKAISVKEFEHFKAFIEPKNIELPDANHHPSIMMIRTFFESNNM